MDSSERSGQREPAETGSEATQVPAGQTPRRLVGGLTPGPARHLFPLFGVFMTVLALDVFLLIMLPYMMATGTDSEWATSGRLSFLGASVLSGLVFGTLAGVVADRRGHSPWWFLAGHLGTFASPLLALSGMLDQGTLMPRLVVFGVGLAGTLAAFFSVQSSPQTGEGPLSPLTRRLSRFWFSFSNIYLGIALLVIFVIALHLGTWWEELYGARSARTRFYTAWWFGALLLLSAFSMIAATFRKYPWRLDQTGWIATHTSLVLIVVGSFMTFWGKEEGSMDIMEGKSKNYFTVDTHTRFAVEQLRKGHGGSTWEPIWESRNRFDSDSSVTRPDEAYEVREGASPLFNFVVDRYYAHGRQKVTWHNDSKDSRAAIELSVDAGGMRPRKIALVSGDARSFSGEMKPLNLSLIDVPSMYDQVGLAYRGGRHELDQAAVVVKNPEGVELLRIPLDLTQIPESRRTERGTDLIGEEHPIPGTNARLKLSTYYDEWSQQIGMAARDESPGKPINPAVRLSLLGPEGVSDHRTAFAFATKLSEPGEADSALKDWFKHYPDLRVYLDYIPPFPLEPLYLIFLREGNSFSWAMELSEGQRRSGTVTEGVPLDLGLRFMATPTRVITHLREEIDWEFRSHKPASNAAPNEGEIARVRVNDEFLWISPGTYSQPFNLGDRDYRIRWFHPRIDLGFELYLRDFHRDFYPGIREAQTYESYLFLTHPEKFPTATPIKIDMNHPLRLDGWRLYQSRFTSPSGGGPEVTVLQVNRDPGLTVLYPACGLLVLALVVVFTQKPLLRALTRWLKAKSCQPGTVFLIAALKIVSTFLATLPGIILILLIPEGAMQGVGALLVGVGLALESWICHRWLRPYFERAASSPHSLQTGVAL